MYIKTIKFISIFTISILIISMLTGCTRNEEEIKQSMLSEIENRYGIDFEIVDFNYNKAYVQYEIGLQTLSTENNYATKVISYDEDSIYDNYYANLYSANVAKEFEGSINLIEDKYVYANFFTDMYSPIGDGLTYEEIIDLLDLKNQIIEINVFIDKSDVFIENIEEEIYNAASRLSNPNCDLNVYFVSEDDIKDKKYLITNHYGFYDDDYNPEFKCDYRVEKRDGIIKIIE